MSPLHTDYYGARGRRSSPVRFDRAFTASRLFGTGRNLSLSRVDERLGLSRGRSPLSAAEADRTRSRSSNDIYAGRSELYADDDLVYGKDDPEPGRLYPSSKLTRGGVPLHKPSGLVPASDASLYRSNHPTPVTTSTKGATSNRTSTSDRKQNRTPSPGRAEKEPRSLLYERKRRLSPPRPTDDSLSTSSGGARKRAYIGRRNNDGHSSTPSTRRVDSSRLQARTRGTSPFISLGGNRGRTSSPLGFHISPSAATKTTEAYRAPSSRSSRSPPNKVGAPIKAIANSSATQHPKPNGPRSSRTRTTASKSTTNEAKPLRVNTKPSQPVKKVRFADAESDTDTDSDTSLLSPVLIEKRRLEHTKPSRPVAVQIDAGSWSHRRPETKSPATRGDPVLRRRRVQ